MGNKKKIGLICHDYIGTNMAGPGIRYFEMAKILAKKYDVVLLSPAESDISGAHPEIKFAVFNTKKSTGSIFSYIKDCDAVIAQSLRPNLILRIKKAGIRYIADLYDPLVIESMEYFKYDTDRYRKIIFNFHQNILLLQLLAGDNVACASDRQRNFYLGSMFDYHIINPEDYSLDPKTESKIFLLPFGFDQESLKSDNPGILEKNYPKISKDDFVVYWGGGVWNWFDPISVVKAIEKISKKRKDIKLFFLGVKHPNPNIKGMEMAQKTLDYCKKSDLLDKFVFFNFGWTPYNERVNYLERASVGISTHFENLETHFSFRTRILDYLWADKPMILTKGDTLAEFAENHEMGIIVDYENPDQIASAIEKMADNKTFYQDCEANIEKNKLEFRWDTILSKLEKIVDDDSQKSSSMNMLSFYKFSFKFYFYGLLKKLTRNKTG